VSVAISAQWYSWGDGSDNQYIVSAYPGSLCFVIQQENCPKTSTAPITTTTPPTILSATPTTTIMPAITTTTAAPTVTSTSSALDQRDVTVSKQL
jgi:hypothetical protein